MDVRAGPQEETFNEVHPPFTDSIDTLPPARTGSGTVGIAAIAPADFDLIRDPAYLWQDMPSVTPKEKEARNRIREQKTAEVKSYRLVRLRYWELVGRLQFATEVQYSVRVSQGIETSHQESESKTRTEVIGVTLGLELSGDLFKPTPGKAAAALHRDLNSEKGASGQGSAEFTYQLTNELRFERIDTQTYRQETEVSTQTTFEKDHLYYVWQLNEALLLSRVRPTGDEPEPVSEIIASTGIQWTDRVAYSKPEDRR